MTVEDKIDDKELKDINPQRDDYEDEIIQIIKSDEPAYKKKEELDDKTHAFPLPRTRAAARRACRLQQT